MKSISIKGRFGVMKMTLSVTSDCFLMLVVALNNKMETVVGKEPLRGAKIAVSDLQRMLANVNIVYMHLNQYNETVQLTFTGGFRVDGPYTFIPSFNFNVCYGYYRPVSYGSIGRNRCRCVCMFGNGNIEQNTDNEAHVSKPGRVDWDCVTGRADLVTYIERRDVGLGFRFLSELELDDNIEDFFNQQ